MCSSSASLPSLAAAASAFLVTDLARLLFFLGGGQGAAAGTVVGVAVREFLVTLPLLPLVFWIYRWIHSRVSEDY